jgi:hypothetical protein
MKTFMELFMKFHENFHELFFLLLHEIFNEISRRNFFHEKNPLNVPEISWNFHDFFMILHQPKFHESLWNFSWNFVKFHHWNFMKIGFDREAFFLMGIQSVKCSWKFITSWNDFCQGFFGDVGKLTAMYEGAVMPVTHPLPWELVAMCTNETSADSACTTVCSPSVLTWFYPTYWIIER